MTVSVGKIDARFIRFLLVGLSNTILSYAVFRVSLSLLPDFGGAAAVAQGFSYSAGLFWSYFWNRVWSFRSSEVMFGEFSKFVVLQLSLLVLSAAAISVLVDIFGLAPTISWVSVMFFITLINFAVLKYWVFR